MSAKKEKQNPYFVILVAALFIAVIVFAANAIAGFSRSARDKELETIQNNLVRCAVSCYALEGFFPEDINYLAQNYGFSLNREKYVYYYDYQGDNLIPNIRVFDLGGEAK